ncbi:hypothetical protein DL96DRAFT_1149033 [Flagelloscypha sp. PMI_526]|nr:hypothetical protein DL96DRAFT_1149033 [Flagelloscypha sp. PMI_526]
MSWRQPAGLPALATAFNKHIGLCRIVNRIRRTVYTPRTLTLSTPEAWEKLGVTDLDSLLNEWLDRLPKHLLLDLNFTKDTHFYRQSVGLHAAFRDTQILVHRLFLFSPATAPKEMISNSFVICSNAAKGVAKLVQTCGKPRVCPPIIIQVSCFQLVPSNAHSFVKILDTYAEKCHHTTYNRLAGQSRGFTFNI